jgi:hypothetical protein
MTLKSWFFTRRTILLPTWRGWLCVVVAAVALVLGVGRFTHGFLSVNAPIQANVLVVEGWLPDYAIEEALAEFRAGGYERLVTSGGPMPEGSLVSGYSTYAALATATVLKLGFPKDHVMEAPAARTYRHRTFESAKAVRTRLRELGVRTRGLNVVSVGPHARRTRAVYRKVFNDEIEIGVIAIESRDYDPKRWWAFSDGVKVTLAEAVAWLYEALLDSGR